MTKQIKMDEAMKEADAQIGGAVKGSGNEGVEPKVSEYDLRVYGKSIPSPAEPKCCEPLANSEVL